MISNSALYSVDQRDSIQARAARIFSLKIEFILSDEFEPMLAAKSRLSKFEAVLQNDSSEDRDPGKMETVVCTPRDSRQTLLSFAEEQHEFRRMNFLKFQAARLRSKLDPQHPDLEAMAEIERLLAESRQVRDHLIQCNLGLVASNAGKYCSSNYGYDDLVSDGSLALMGAVEKFNYQRGFRFSTYATLSIRRSFFRKIERRQIHRKRFPLTDPEVMESSPDDVRIELNDPAQNRLADHIVQEFSNYLNDRERQIIECRFGLNGQSETQTLMQLSSELGISKERVRQVEGIALSKLRAVVGWMTEHNCTRVSGGVKSFLKAVKTLDPEQIHAR